MEINNLYYGILLYIIIVAILVFYKPEFIYDHKRGKYKEYGTTGDKIIFTLPVIAILLALVISIFISITSKKQEDKIISNPHNSNNLHNLHQFQTIPPIQYVPIYYQQINPLQQLQQLQQLQPSINQLQSLSLGHSIENTQTDKILL